MVDRISKIKEQIYHGHIVDLHPYDLKYAADIILLRNQEKAKYFLAQDFNLQIQQQFAWMQAYLKKEDEIGFVITNKNDKVVGAAFLYNYDGDTIELGRAVFDLNKTIGAPYTLEFTIIVLDIAFDIIQAMQIVAHVKEDNFLLVKFLKKLGFVVINECIIRDRVYFRLSLSACNRTYQQYNRHISAWTNKYNK